MRLYVKATAVDANGKSQEVLIEVSRTEMKREGSAGSGMVEGRATYGTFKFREKDGFDAFAREHSEKTPS